MPHGPAEEFPAVDEAGWRDLVASVLKGRSFDRLIARTYDDIAVAPLYPRPSGAAPRAPRADGDWRIVQRLDEPDPLEANAQARRDLAGGADALALVGAASAAGRGFGVRLASPGDLAAVLAGIDLDRMSLRLDVGSQAPTVADWLLDHARERHLVAAGLDVDIGFDPFADHLRSGHSALTPKAIGEIGRDLGRKLREAGFSARVFLADGRPAHEGGASQAQELALVLAAAVAYLRSLEAAGVPLETAFGDIAFLLAADADQFLTIAKFRALRLLWARVAEACGLVPVAARLHAETAWRMQTVYDPWVNILRSSLAVFAAGIGGADAIAALPFTAALGLADEFARRIARNSQLILLRESHLGQVADPAAGAGAFEALTGALCDKAWSLFQAIEQGGGLAASLAAGVPQGWIAATAAARAKAFAQRREALTGTSEFPDLAELPVAVLAPLPQVPPQQGAAPGTAAAMQAAPLPSRRDGEAFEHVRQRAEADAARGQRPKLFLANYGAAPSFLARMTFAAAFFGIAGIEAGPDAGAATVDEIVAAYAASGARIACICAGDAQLASDGSRLVAALKAAGARQIFVVAQPSAPFAPELEGVTFLHQGCDSLALLEAALAAA